MSIENSITVFGSGLDMGEYSVFITAFDTVKQEEIETRKLKTFHDVEKANNYATIEAAKRNIRVFLWV